MELPSSIDVKGRDGALHRDVPMWTYWCLEEGTLGVDPKLGLTNDGRMGPVLHVDTDAPLYSDVDGSLITDKLWGIYYKPDFNFKGIQGGATPYRVERDPDQVAVDPYGPSSPEFIVDENFAHMWCSALAFCQKRYSGRIGQWRDEPSGGIGCFSPDSFPVIDVFHAELLRDRRLQSRLQDDRARQAGRGRNSGRQEPTVGAVSLLPLRRGQAASGLATVRFRGADHERACALDRPDRATGGGATRCEAAAAAKRDRPRKSCATAGAGGPGQAGARKDQGARHQLYLLSVHIGDRTHCRQGCAGRSLGSACRARLPAGLRRDREFVPGSTLAVHRLRTGSHGACRHPGSRDVLSVAVGQAGGARLLHHLPQSRGEGRCGRVPDLRLPRQSAARARAVPGRPRPAHASRLRAGDDVAEKGCRRQRGAAA